MRGCEKNARHERELVRDCEWEGLREQGEEMLVGLVGLAGHTGWWEGPYNTTNMALRGAASVIEAWSGVAAAGLATVVVTVVTGKFIALGGWNGRTLSATDVAAPSAVSNVSTTRVQSEPMPAVAEPQPENNHASVAPQPVHTSCGGGGLTSPGVGGVGGAGLTGMGLVPGFCHQFASGESISAAWSSYSQHMAGDASGADVLVKPTHFGKALHAASHPDSVVVFIATSTRDDGGGVECGVRGCEV